MAEALTPQPPSAPYPGDGGGAPSNEAPQDETEKRQWMRDKVSREIVDTEKSYVASLCQVMECYITPLSANTKILSVQEVQTLFSNMQVICTLNMKLLSDLEKRLKEWDTNPCLGDIFLNFAHFFKMYTQYVGNHDKASAMLDFLNDDRSKFKSFCTAALSEGKAKGTPLSSYLIKPIQRIPRYKLLLEQMVKFTDPEHPDFTNSSKALELVSEVALQVNEAVRQQQDRAAVLRVNGMFTTTENFVHPARYFIRHGPLMKKCRSSNKPYEFFLFNDLLLYCTQGTVGGKFNIRQRIEINQNFDIKDEPDAGGLKNLWSIISSTKSFTAFCDDPAVKASWLKDLGKVYEEAQKRVDRNAKTTDMKQPVWISDDLAKDCAVCKKSFGVFRGKHHCRYCGNVVCDSCSTERMILGPKKPDSVAQRVCDQCVSKLKKSQAEKDQQMTALMLSAIAPKKNDEVKINNSAHHLDLMHHHKGTGVAAFNSLAPPPGARQPRRSLSQGAIKVPAHIQAIKPGGTLQSDRSQLGASNLSRSPPARAVPTPPKQPTMSKAASTPAVPDKPVHRTSWVERISPEGHPYYENNDTGETTWNKPIDMLIAERGSKGSPWVEMYNEDGYAYYMNIVTQESVWEKPADYDDPSGGSGADTAAVTDSSSADAGGGGDGAGEYESNGQRLSSTAPPPSLTSVMDNSSPPEPPKLSTLSLSAGSSNGAKPPARPPATPPTPAAPPTKRPPPAAPTAPSTPSTPSNGPKPPPRANGSKPPSLDLSNGTPPAPTAPAAASGGAKKFAPPSRAAAAPMPTLTESAPVAPPPTLPTRKPPPVAPAPTATPPSIISKAPPPKPFSTATTTNVSSPTGSSAAPALPPSKKPPPRANTAEATSTASKPKVYASDDSAIGSSSANAESAPEPPPRRVPPSKPVPAAPAAPADDTPKLPPRKPAPAPAPATSVAEPPSAPSAPAAGMVVKPVKTNSAVAAMNASLLDKEKSKPATVTSSAAKEKDIPLGGPTGNVAIKKTPPPVVPSATVGIVPTAAGGTKLMPAEKRDSTPALPPRKAPTAATTAGTAKPPTPTTTAAAKATPPTAPKATPPPIAPGAPVMSSTPRESVVPALPPRKAPPAATAAAAASGPKKFTAPSLNTSAPSPTAASGAAAASPSGAKPPARPGTAGAATPPPRTPTTTTAASPKPPTPTAPPPRPGGAAGGKQLRAPPPVPTDDEWQD